LDTVTETPRGTLIGDFWRFIPRGWKVAGALAVLGFAAFETWFILDAARRTRLRESIRERLAALPPEPADTEVADEDNAALVYRKAFRALDRSAAINWYYFQQNARWKTPPKEVTAALEKNGEALNLVRAALEKPGFATEQSPGTAYGYRVGNLWELITLSQVRAVVDLRGGRIGEAVAAALLPARMARQVGPGRDFPWNIVPEYTLQGPIQYLFEAVAHPGFDGDAARAVLRDLPSAGEECTSFVAAFERANLRRLGGSLVEFLGGTGGRRARAGGWAAPSLAQRLKAKIGTVRLPPGMDSLPSTGDIERAWAAAVAHRAIAGVRGGDAAKALVADMAVEVAGWGRDPGTQYRYSLRSEFMLEARLETIRAAAALRLFELLKGRAPASLGELVPELLPAMPRDPFTDGPLRYETGPDGWTVSSAGPPGSWPTNFPWELPSITWKRPAPAPAPQAPPR
jgi:hypothetical protein